MIKEEEEATAENEASNEEETSESTE